MKEYIIYKITNLITKKSYIGRTNDLERRLREHVNSNVCRYLHNAIKKYGLDSFSVEILLDRLSFEEAKKIEGKLIKEHKTLAPHGYNLLAETESGREPCQETRKRMGISGQKAKGGESKGVRFHSGKYQSRVNFEGKNLSRSFETEDEAKTAYDKCCLFLYGEKAWIHFEDKRGEYLKENLESFFENFKKAKEESSSFEGVILHNLVKKWRSYLYKDKRMITLGFHETEVEAAEANDKARLFLFGEEIKLNIEQNRKKYLSLNLKEEFDNLTRKKQKSSKHKGVYRSGKKWRAYYCENKKSVDLGGYDTEQEAYEKAKQFYK